MNREETAKILTGIAAIYQNFQASPGAVDIWTRVLSDFSYTKISRACLHYFSTPAQFAPTPGQLIQIIREDLKASSLSAEAAWQLALAACGFYQSRKRNLLPQRIQKIMRGIGWERAANADVETELHWIRKEFIEAYEQSIEAELKDPSLLSLRSRQMEDLRAGDPQRAITGGQDTEVLRKVFGAMAGGKDNQAIKAGEVPVVTANKKGS